MVIAHEMAHQWFGDLVTMQWWDDLWLNEAFATWAENRAEAALHPEWQPWLEFRALARRARWRPTRSPATHPIRMPVTNPEQAHEAFDSITYAKGAAVLAHARALARRGELPARRRRLPARARRGQRHRRRPVARARRGVARSRCPRWRAAWIDRAGHPLVTATARCNGGKTELVLTQARDGAGSAATKRRG